MQTARDEALAKIYMEADEDTEIELLGGDTTDQIERREARRMINEEYDDIAGNKELLAKACEADESLMAQGDTRPYRQRIKAALDWTRKQSQGGSGSVDDYGIVRALQMGTEDEAVAALRQIRGQLTASVSADPDGDYSQQIESIRQMRRSPA